MAQSHRRPIPGRIGTHPYVLRCGPIGGANNIGGATAITATATTIFRTGPVMRKSIFTRLGALIGTTLPVSAGGTLLVTARKYRASDDQVVTLSGTIDLEALVLREARYAEALAGLRDADLFFNIGAGLAVGDGLEFHVVSSAAIGTQPVGLELAAEMLMIE